MKELPEGWEWKKLTSLGEFYNGGTPNTKIKKYWKGDIPWVTGADISSLYITKGRKTISKKGLENSATNLVLKNSLLIVTRTGVGKIGIAKNDITFSQDITALVCNKELEPIYIARYLNFIGNRLKQFERGATIKGITRSTLDKIKIPLPPLPVQHRIAEILDKADNLRHKRKQVNNLADTFLQAVFLDMFGDPVRNPKGWPLKYLYDISENNKNAIKSGPFGSSLKKETYKKKGYKIYGQEQVIRNDFNYGDYYISTKKYNELKNYRIKAGDILISLVGTFGKISIVPEKIEPGIINPRLIKISLNQKIVIPDFFKYLLLNQSLKAKIAKFAHGGTMDIINLKILKSIKFPIPEFKLQKEFVLIVKHFEDLKKQININETELNKLFNSTIQRAFNGDLVLA